MGSDSKNNSNNNEKRPALFQLTKQQISSSIEKYDKAAAAIQVFKTIPIDESKLREKPVIFQKRLNSLDSTILEENAYKVLDNPDLKLEKKIENCEAIIKSLEEEIIVADTVKDEATKNELIRQKDLLLKNLENMKAEYTEQSVDTMFTSVIASVLQVPSKLQKEANKWFRLLLRQSKFLRKFTPLMKALYARDTLDKLDKINKSVDQLVKMKVPFGEQEAKYQVLINHLAKANALHAQIKKELNS